MRRENVLQNIVWHSLTGPHTGISVGTDTARRYAPGFSPLMGFADPQHPDFTALAAFSVPEEPLYSEGWSGDVPTGWHIVFEGNMVKMVLAEEVTFSDEAPEAIPLGPEQAQQALDLATLTRPGPFGIRTIEMGNYYGIFDGDRLVSMAGERLFPGAYREISGVCTHPDFQGRGFASRLMKKLIHAQRRRGETPILHVMAANTTARQIYQRMGLRDYSESLLRVVAQDG